MADAAAPQNSISTGTSMRMSVKVKYVLWRVLKDASQDRNNGRRARGGRRREGKEGKNGREK